MKDINKLTSIIKIVYPDEVNDLINMLDDILINAHVSLNMIHKNDKITICPICGLDMA